MILRVIKNGRDPHGQLNVSFIYSLSAKMYGINVEGSMNLSRGFYIALIAFHYYADMSKLL
jgi:hypothetical protein